jgi:hypothetical protein
MMQRNSMFFRLRNFIYSRDCTQLQFILNSLQNRILKKSITVCSVADQDDFSCDSVSSLNKTERQKFNRNKSKLASFPKIFILLNSEISDEQVTIL